MDYHTDSRQTYAGQKIAQACNPTHPPHTHPHSHPPPRTPYAQDHDTAVITYTIGSSDMRFCYHDYIYKGKKLPTQHYFMLNEDEALVWMPVHAHAHTPRTHTRQAHTHARRHAWTHARHTPTARPPTPHTHRTPTHPPTHPRVHTSCPQRDDHAKKHGVWWRPRSPKDAVRHVLVYRWTNVEAKRAYHVDYPHRPVATGAHMPLHRARMPCPCTCTCPRS